MLYNFLLEITRQNASSNSFHRLSQHNPHVTIELWCNNQNDIIELKGTKDALDKAILELEEDLGSVVKTFPERNHVQLVVKLCKCTEFPLDTIFNKYDCLELPPTKYLAGREIVNLIVTPDDAGLILEDIRKKEPIAEVNVLKLAPLKTASTPYPFYLPLSQLKKSLTEKQQIALSTAYKKGYYDIPRAIPLKTLAKEIAISRRTFDEHLRKAEKKIMSFLVPAILNFE
ncbi:MAG: helix-turn-helix domain-containing protein [Candidatus Hodarchaeales archaeon]